jgi:hypothetical protein
MTAILLAYLRLRAALGCQYPRNVLLIGCTPLRAEWDRLVAARAAGRRAR